MVALRLRVVLALCPYCTCTTLALHQIYFGASSVPVGAASPVRHFHTHTTWDMSCAMQIDGQLSCTTDFERYTTRHRGSFVDVQLGLEGRGTGPTNVYSACVAVSGARLRRCEHDT